MAAGHRAFIIKDTDLIERDENSFGHFPLTSSDPAVVKQTCWDWQESIFGSGDDHTSKAGFYMYGARNNSREDGPWHLYELDLDAVIARDVAYELTGPQWSAMKRYDGTYGQGVAYLIQRWSDAYNDWIVEGPRPTVIINPEGDSPPTPYLRGIGNFSGGTLVTEAAISFNEEEAESE